jgi:16S rRNA (guanine527-N7)-methyltransferase
VIRPHWGPQRFRDAFYVSRETLDRLEVYRAVLLAWNRRINLIARSSEADVWGRHFADSAQLLRYCPPTAQLWLDLGSGAGFPGLVVAVIAAETRPGLRVELVESDARKAAFLTTASRECGVSVRVHAGRSEALPPAAADVVSARAVAALADLLALAQNHLGEDGICLFPKGRSVHDEIQRARRSWRFQLRTHQSLTDPEAGILQIGAIERV